MNSEYCNSILLMFLFTLSCSLNKVIKHHGVPFLDKKVVVTLGENFYVFLYDSAIGAGSRTYKIQYRRLVGQTAYISNAKILAIELGIGP